MGGSGSGSLVRLLSGCWLELPSSEGLTGWRTHFNVAHSHGCQVSASCLQEVSVPSHVGLFIGPLEWPHNMAAACLQSEGSETAGQKAP